LLPNLYAFAAALMLASVYVFGYRPRSNITPPTIGFLCGGVIMNTLVVELPEGARPLSESDETPTANE